MNELRIRRHRMSGCYRIDEKVTAQGHYISWPGLFTTVAAAVKEVERGMRGKSFMLDALGNAEEEG